MSSNTLTWDDATPRRPGINDVGGGLKENDPTYPPDPGTMPTAEDFNQISKQAVAFGKMVPSARLSLTISGGTPTVTLLAAAGSVPVTADFTPTDMGAGDTRITVGASKIPAIVGVHATQQDDVAIDRVRIVLESAVAFRVKTFLGATGTDCNVLLDVF